MEERLLEVNEGLAEYTGIVTAIPPALQRGWTVRSLEQAQARARESSLSKTFAYATGPAYGLLLDASDVNWREQVDGEFELATRAAAAHGLGNRERASNEPWRQRALRYQGQEVERFERARAAERGRHIARIRGQFLDGPVLVLPVDEGFSYSFDPGAVENVPGVGQVLHSAVLRAGWGVLEVSGSVALRPGDGGFVAAVVPAPAEDGDGPPTSRPGWTLQLAGGWRLEPGARPGDWQLRSAPPQQDD